MPEQDELQIRIGLSLDGVQQSETESKRTEERTARVERRVTQAKAQVSNLERRGETLAKNMLKAGARTIIYSSLTDGLESLIPNQDHNAYTTLAKIGGNAAVGYMFGGPAGAFITLIASALGAVQERLRAHQEKIAQLEKEAGETKKRTDEAQEQSRRRIADIEKELAKDVKEGKERLYVELRSL